MKGKIDREGYLWIERAGKEKEAQCRDGSFCGDWCIKFREPNFPGCQILKICGNETLEFTGGLVDERGKE